MEQEFARTAPAHDGINAEQAAEIWEESPDRFGVIITDQNMAEGRTGLALIKEIKDAVKTRLPLMFLHSAEFNTSSSAVRLMGEAREAGAQGVPKGMVHLFEEEILQKLGMEYDDPQNGLHF